MYYLLAHYMYSSHGAQNQRKQPW